MRRRRTLGKFSINLFQYTITIPHLTPYFTLVQGISSSLVDSIEGSYPAGSWYPSFKGCGTREARFHFLVQKQGTFRFSSYLVRPSKLLVRLNNIMIYPARACRPKLMRLSVTSWDMLQTTMPIGSSHFTGYDVNGYCFHIASYEQSWPNRRTTNSGVFIPSTMNFYLQMSLVANLLVLSYSNVIGLILE
jgi:hypothetical protein